MPARRIAMFQPALRDSMGVAGHQDLGAALRALGHEFEMLSTAATPPTTAQPWRTLLEPSWTRGVVAEVGAPFFRTRWLLGAALALAHHLRRPGNGVDVIYTLIAYPQATAAALAIAWSGWPGRLVVMPGGEDLMIAEEANFGFRRFPVPRRMVGWTLRRAHGILCQSPAIEEVVRSYRPKGVIRNAPDNVAESVVRLAETSESESSERRRLARQNVDREFGVAGKPVLLALGRLHPVKGFDRLIDLLGDLPHRLIVAGPSIEMRGRGDIAARLRTQAVERGVSDRVAFTGKVSREKSYELLAAADVLGVPSHCEGMPKTAVEAAALGTPFAITDSCGVAAEPNVEKLGRVVPAWNPAAFADAVIAATELRTTREDARVFVERFSPRRVAADIAGLLHEISA